jgi:uncharacterized protein with HEPN domain
MAGFRDVLIHNYDDLNMETIWETVDAYLPSAVKQIEKILNKISHQTNFEQYLKKLQK